jgi:hypothetical protein
VPGVVEEPRAALEQLVAKGADRAPHAGLRAVLDQRHREAGLGERRRHRARIVDRVPQGGRLVRAVADHQRHPALVVPRGLGRRERAHLLGGGRQGDQSSRQERDEPHCTL